MKTDLLELDTVQLDRTGLVIDWVEKLRIWMDSDNGTVYIEQGDDLVVIPVCYTPELIKTIEKAKNTYAETRHSNSGLRRNT